MSFKGIVLNYTRLGTLICICKNAIELCLYIVTYTRTVISITHDPNTVGMDSILKCFRIACNYSMSAFFFILHIIALYTVIQNTFKLTLYNVQYRIYTYIRVCTLQFSPEK